jgi:hypothetical protein
MNIEEQRDCLVNAIRECRVFGKHLLIDTGTVIFLFDTERKFEFKDEMLKNLDKDKIYKDHFIESMTKAKQFIDITDLKKSERLKKKMFDVNETVIFDCKLNGRNKQFNITLAEQLFKKNKIKYDFSNHGNIVFFLDDYLE